jgi:hypothetical protein
MLATDCTLVTACFDLSKYHGSARSAEKTLAGMRHLLCLPVHLVVFGTPHLIAKIREERASFGYAKMTYLRECEYEDIWSAQFTEKVRANREKYWPTRDARTCPESHLVCCNKFDFVLTAMDVNPFGTSKYGWIDSNLEVGDAEHIKIGRNYTKNMIPKALSYADPRKFQIQVMGCVDKKYKEKAHKAECYEHYRWLVCGCLFVCGVEVGGKILRRLKELVMETTLSGYGHGEEMFYLEVLDEFRGDIRKSYGDYGEILNNFMHVTTNVWYVYHNILVPCLNMGYYEDAVDCAERLIETCEGHHLTEGVDYGLYISSMRLCYYALQYLDQTKASALYEKMERLAEVDGKFKDGLCGYVA